MTYNGLLKATSGHYQSFQVYGYLSLAFVCLKIYRMSLIINIVKRNIKSPHKIGIQNPDLSILIRPMEIDVIERKIR
jgi:hypothetical protein